MSSPLDVAPLVAPSQSSLAETPTILTLMDDPALLGRHFAGASWNAWRVVLRAMFGLPITDEGDLALFRDLTGRGAYAPGRPAREAWLVVGRRGGKSRISSLVAVYLALCRDYSALLAPGETGTVMVIAADRQQARVVYRYVRGLIASCPTLAARITKEETTSLTLRGLGDTEIAIEVATASHRAVRGYTTLAVVADETAFWRTDESSALPDKEVFAALRPGMATVPGALLLAIGSPYRRLGEMWDAHSAHFGADDSDVLVVQAPTRVMNANVPQAFIDRAMEEDEPRAQAEYNAQFRTDIESFLSREVVNAAIVPGRGDVPPAGGTTYAAFTDPAGGSGGDSYTLAIAHKDRTAGMVVIDAVREVRPPFSPDEVTRQFADLLKLYGLRKVTGDAYAGDWPKERFAVYSITYDRSPLVKSQIYLNSLPLFNEHKVQLPDLAKLKSQLLGLERRTARGGRDSIDHAPRSHDDIANSVCGAALLVPARSKYPSSMSNFDGEWL